MGAIARVTGIAQGAPSSRCRVGIYLLQLQIHQPPYELHSENLLPGGRRIVQAALDFRPPYLQSSDIPLLWEPKTFAKGPALWSQARELGLCHGWLQPVHQGVIRSCLALLRPHVSMSITELYEKAAGVMWLTERLHLAAGRDAAVRSKSISLGLG